MDTEEGIIKADRYLKMYVWTRKGRRRRGDKARAWASFVAKEETYVAGAIKTGGRCWCFTNAQERPVDTARRSHICRP